jgi:ParB family transcriptional regulator, chromosome partitioning protein
MNDLDLSISEVFPNPKQPRKDFDPEKLEELSLSIKQYGVLEPIVVTLRGDCYMIVSGERRYRASLLAGLTTIPARIIEADDALVEELALLENIQRQDLNVIEIARAYKALLDRGWTKEDLAKKMGFKQAWRIDEKISLLNLAPEHQRLIVERIIGNAQAQEMARVGPSHQAVILRKIRSGELVSYNKLRSFVDGLIMAEKQEAIFAFTTITEEEKKSINDFSGLLRTIERLIVVTQDNGSDHLKKAVFHANDITPERVDLIIQHLVKIRKVILAGAGVKDALVS